MEPDPADRDSSMKALSAGMLIAIAQEVMSLVTCWHVTRRDGAEYFFTDHVENLVVDGDTYIASTGMTASAVTTSEDLSVDNLEVGGAISSASFTENDILAGKWDYAAIQIFQVDYNNVANGKIIQRTGTLGQISLGRVAYKTELRGMLQPYAQAFGRLVSPGCDTDLGSARCTKSLVAFTHLGVVDSSANRYTFVDAALAGFAPGGGTLAYFVGGTATFTSGLNNGVIREIRTYVSATGTFTLFESFPFTIAVGDAVTVVAGCDKNLSTCRDKFNNVINFQGFPTVPGRDSLFAGPLSS